jgi:HK97 family phage portal protein
MSIKSKILSKAAQVLAPYIEIPTTAVIPRTWQSIKKQQIDLYNVFKNYSGNCINLRSNTLSGIPVFVKQGEKEVSNDHWLKRLIQKPNQYLNLTWNDTIQMINANLDSSGNAYIWNPPLYKYPIQLWVIPSDRVTSVPSSVRAIDYYRVMTPSGYIIISPEDMCHIKTLKPSRIFEQNFYIGTPILLEAAIDAIEADNEQRAFLTSVFNTGGVSPLTLTVPKGNVTQQHIDTIKMNVKNVDVNRQVAAILEEGEAFSNIPQSEVASQALQNMFRQNDNAKMICASFYVPYTMIDTSISRNVSTAQDDYRRFMENGIDPQMTKILSNLNNYFSRWEPVELYHEKYVWKDTNYELIRDKQNLDYGILSRNDIRIREGLQAIAGGDELLIPNNLNTWTNLLNPPIKVNPIGLNTVNFNTKDSIDFASKYKTIYPLKDISVKYSDLTEAEKVLEWKKLDNKVQIRRKAIQDGIKKVFIEMRDTLLNEYKGKEGKVLLIKKSPMSAIQNLDIEHFKKRIETECNPEMTKLVMGIIKDTLKKWSPETSISEFEKQMQEITKLSTDKIKDSINTIQENLKETIQGIVDSNPDASKDELYSKINGQITSDFDGEGQKQGYIKWRTSLIAQTTSTVATAGSQNMIHKELGLVSIWMTQRDSQVRDSHAEMDGKEQVMGVFTFGNGGEGAFPGMIEPASEDYGCRCYLFPERR